MLARLVEHSLVQIELADDGEPRYRLLETMRQYAAERLQQAGETAAARDRHFTHFLALAERAAPALLGAGQLAWLRQLEVEHPNLRRAIEWALQRSDGTDALLLVGRLARFWEMRGHRTEGLDRLEAALAAGRRAPAAGRRAPAAVRARALWAAGLLAEAVRDEQAIGWLEESLALYRQLEDQAGAAWALYNLAWAAVEQGELDRSQRLAAESLASFRVIGYQPGVAACLIVVVRLAAARGLPGQAAHWLAMAGAVHRTIGAPLSLPDQARAVAVTQALSGQLDAASFAAAHASGDALSPDEIAVAVGHALESLARLPDGETPAPSAQRLSRETGEG